jgi:putative transposase
MVHELMTSLARALVGLLRSRAALLAENALLRQQIIVLRRAAPHPRFKARDRLAISAMTKLFPSLVAAVAIVRPETVLRWHRSLWKLLWRRRSRRPVGRPPVDADTRALIRRMWKENPLWGEDVIAAELAKLGHHVSPRTVAKYRPANLPRGRGQKWSTFVRNHLGQTWAAGWFTIVTLRFQVLYAFIILDLGRRQVVRLGVTPLPSARTRPSPSSRWCATATTRRRAFSFTTAIRSTASTFDGEWRASAPDACSRRREPRRQMPSANG